MILNNLTKYFSRVFSISTLLFLVNSIFASRPNIVLIMADDLGFSDLGCYGSEIKTPNLDRLANNGLRFTQFYNTAKCHSSRVSLLTGLYCNQAGGSSLSRATTIAEVLKSTGYSTWMTGKWHLNKQPTDFGFQSTGDIYQVPQTFYRRQHLQAEWEGVECSENIEWKTFLHNPCNH